MNTLELGRHRRHLARLVDAAAELDENIRLACRELLKADPGLTEKARLELAVACCGAQVAAERLDDALDKLPVTNLRVVA